MKSVYGQLCCPVILRALALGSRGFNDFESARIVHADWSRATTRCSLEL